MKVIFLILLLIIYVINNYFEWQIISFFSPSHLVSSNLLYIIVLPFLYEELSVNSIIFYASFFLLIVFFLLVFNEFIILYCCSLEENTYLEKINKERQYSIQMERISNEYELNNEEANDNNIRNSDELNETIGSNG